MLNKKFYFGRCYRKNKTGLKKEGGFTIIEVVIALLIISIITVVLVRGTIISVDTLKINKVRSKALAVASEKLELIKTMDYENIEFTADNPNWGLDNPMLIEDGYDISYDVARVDVGNDSYKQIKITISTEPMQVPVDVITQIYPMEKPEGELEDYVPPVNLVIESDGVVGGTREIKLVWEAPDTELEINSYRIYRDGAFIGSTSIELFINSPGNNNTVYNFYVTALYADAIESIPSNTVTTETYPPPQNLIITGYSGTGSNRTVNLAWTAPDTPLVIDRYVVYRAGVELARTTNTTYSNKIGKTNYTFYIKVIYQNGIFSNESNNVTTQ